MKQTTKQKVAPWLPAVFCAFLSIMALFFSTGIVGKALTESWRPAFFAFLPMCFYFVGANIYGMNREIRELRQKLADMEEKKAN
jgi:hypothetical protein